MTFQVESPKITEIQVRMDCNGCVQKIHKALQSVQGIYKTEEDFSQQKIIVVGWADPDKLMKAIKRAGKIAKLCSHKCVEEPPKPEAEKTADAAEAAPAPATTVTEAPPEQNSQTATEQNNAGGEPPPPENKPAEEAPPPPPPPAEAPPPPPAEAAPPPPAEAPPAADPKPQENPDPSPPAQPQPSEPYYLNVHPRHDYVVRDGFYGYHMGTHEYMMRYNSPEYVDHYRRYQRDPYYYANNNGRSNDGFSTVFSDENPNACSIA